MASIDPAVLGDFNYQDEVFQDTLTAKLVDSLGLSSSGVLTRLPAGVITNKSGDFATIPQYKTVDGTMNQIVSLTESDVDDFGDYATKAVWLQRDKGWGVENLVNIIANKDPEEEIIRQFSNFMAREMQTTTVNILLGISAATGFVTTNSTGATYEGGNISKESIVAAKQLQGDVQNVLTKFIGHSRVVSDAIGFSMTDFKYNNVGEQVYRSGTTGQVLGMDVWADDMFAAVTSVYSSYIAAAGAINYDFRPWIRRDVNGNKVSSSTFDIEFQRIPNIGGGQDRIWLRATYLVTIMGMSWGVTTTNPTNVQLATGSNWSYVADDPKKINIVQLRTAGGA